MAYGRFTRQELDEAALTKLLNSPTGGTMRDLIRRGLRVQATAKRLCHGDTGRLRGSIDWVATFRVRLIRRTPVVEIGTNVKYALWVHEGTGVYGPRGTPIVPTSARYLVFTIKGGARRDAHGRFVKGARGSKVIKIRSVKGQEGTHFLRDALPSARA